MRAICVIPRHERSAHLRDVPPPAAGRGQALVRVLRVGVCGTDNEINAGLYGEAPPGADFLVLGHESFGQVEKVPAGIRGLRPGDYVVATVRRPCPERCVNCRAGANDMCLTQHYLERGIKGRHGYMAERYAESPEFLVKVPARLAEMGVLLEPLSIVEKAIAQAYAIQERLQWRPKRALVTGAGMVGILVAMLLRLRGLATYVVSREPATSRRAQLVQAMGAKYLEADGQPLTALPAKVGDLDLIVEGAGSSALAFAAMEILGTNGILCLLGVTGGDRRIEVPTDKINLNLVLRNQVIFGSVNANRTFFEMGVTHLEQAARKWRGLPAQFITRRVPLARFPEALDRGPDDLKVTLEVGDAR